MWSESSSLLIWSPLTLQNAWDCPKGRCSFCGRKIGKHSNYLRAFCKSQALGKNASWWTKSCTDQKDELIQAVSAKTRTTGLTWTWSPQVTQFDKELWYGSFLHESTETHNIPCRLPWSSSGMLPSAVKICPWSFTEGHRMRHSRYPAHYVRSELSWSRSWTNKCIDQERLDDVRSHVCWLAGQCARRGP